MAEYGRPISMDLRRPPWLRAFVTIAVAVALALMVVPVRATYLNKVGSDTLEYRTASCGAPIASLLGADAELDGGSDLPIGGQTSKTSCEAASGRRVVAALVLLLGTSVGWGLGRRWSAVAPSRLKEDLPT